MTRSSKGRWIGIGVLAALLVAVFLRMNPGKVWEYTRGVSWRWVLLAAVLNLVETWIEAVRWKLILSRVKKSASVNSVLSAILVGILGNTLMPLRIGDGMRAYFLARKEDISMASSLSSVMLDYILNTLYFFLIAVAVFFLYPFPLSLKHPYVYLSIPLIALVFLVAALIQRRRLTCFLREKLGSKVSSIFLRFMDGLSALRNAGILFHASVITLFLWGMKAFMIWCMIQAYHLDLGMVEAALILVLINIGIAVVSTPANVGGFELAAIAGLTLLSVNTEAAVSLSVVYHVVEVVPVMILGFITLSFSGMHFRDLFHFRTASPGLPFTEDFRCGGKAKTKNVSRKRGESGMIV